MQFNSKIAVLSLFFCLIFGLAFWQFIHKDLQRKILQMDLERQKMTQISLNILNYKNKYGNLDEYMQKLEERFQKSNNILPEKIQQGEFVNFLQKTALEHQVKIISITPSAIKSIDDINDIKSDADTDHSGEVVEDLNINSKSQSKTQQLTKLSINIKIECQYISMIHFLKAIEDSERLMIIENLSIISKDNGDWLISELNISIFALNEN